MRALLLVCGLLSTFLSQAVSLRGRVTDARTGEALPGAVVLVQGTSLSAPTDAAGRYEIPNVPAGHYLVQASFVGYQPGQRTVDVPSSGEVAPVDFALQTQAQNLGTVAVTGKLNQEEENASRLTERTADNVLNVIGARAMERSPDINAANVLQRVSGVTVQRNAGSDGAYAVIRGLEPRYNNTLVNGIKIASPDNVNRYVSLDIVPSDLLKRIEVSKALLPSMEADAIGGTVNLVMKDAPDTTLFRATASVGYSQLFFGRRFSSFSKTDIQAESLNQRFGADYSATPADFSRSNLRVVTQQAPPTYLAGLTFGHRYLGNRLGVLVAVNTQNQFYGSDGTYNYVVTGRTNEPSIYRASTRQTYNQQRNSGLVTHLDFNLSEHHKLAFDNVVLLADLAELRTTVDTTLTDQRRGPGTGTVHELLRTRTTRQVVENAKLSGRHELAPRLLLDWTAGYSLATRNAPDEAQLDIDRLLSPQPDGSIKQSPNSLNGLGRVWQHNRDRDYSALAGLAWQPQVLGHDVELRLGGLYRDKERFNLQDEYSLKAAADANGVKQVYTTIDAAQFVVYTPKGTYFYDVANYTAYERIGAGYAQAKAQLGPVQALGGVRVENTQQGFGTKLISTALDQPSAIAKSYTDILPSLHLRASLGERQNLRLSYFASLARPNYYELVPYTSRASTDYLIEGNPALRHTTADNYDLRYEIYPSAEDFFTLGGYYKRLTDPIELVFRGYGSGQLTLRPENGNLTTIAGVEVAFTKYFGPHVGLLGNYTYAHSRTSSLKVFNDQANNTNYSVSQERPLQGQADHVLNLSLLLRDQPTGLFVQTSYQYTGRTLRLIGASFDYYQQPQSSLAVSAEKDLRRHFTAFAKLNNLLNTPSELKVNDSNVVQQRDTFRATYLLGLRYAL